MVMSVVIEERWFSGSEACSCLCMAVIVDGNVHGDREMVFTVGTLISGLQLLVHGSDS